VSLLERQPFLDDLARRCEHAKQGQGQAVFVCGEAGIGKSALVGSFLANQTEVRILRGYCDALVTPHALGPVSEIYTQAFGTTAADLSRDQLFVSLITHLLAGDRLVLVVIEDLHWADEATLDFVRYLGRRIGSARAMLIATFRDDEAGPTHPLRRALGDLNAAHVSRLNLLPLSRTAVAQLASAAGQDGSRVFDITGGNPFFVREVISAPIGCVPSTVRDAMLARLARCSPSARQAAEWVALTPGRMDVTLLTELLGACDTAIDECIERGILLHERGALSFRHELARSAIENSVAPAGARQRHARICAALVARSGEVARVVHHAREAHDPTTLLEYAPEAARRAACVGAHREAAAYYATALEHVGKLPISAQVALYEAHAYECYLTSRIDTAVQSALKALDIWRSLGDRQAQGRTLRFLSRQHWFLGRQEEALRYARDSIAMHEAFPADRDLAMAYSNRSQLEMLRGAVADAIAFGEKAVEIARAVGDVEIESHALNNIGTALISADDESGRPPLERSLQLALAHDLHEHVARAYVNLATTATRRQDVDRAQTYLRDGIAYCDERDLDSWTTYLQVYQARFDLDRGDWARALQGASLLLDHTGSSAITRIPALVVLAQVRMRQGEGEVQPLLDEALECALPTGELQRIGRVIVARAEYAWHRQDMAAVVEEAELGLSHAAGHRDPWIEGELLFWKSLAAPVSSTSALPPAFAAAIRGDWQQAALRFEADRMPFEQALMLLAGGPDTWPMCEEIIARLGAKTLRARLTQVRDASRTTRKSTQSNPYGLTNRELEVLALLSQGHTNAELARRLFLSAKTIDHHVSAILGKLQVRSRVHAVSVAHEMGLTKRP
jgi:DNA-binding CsgD family transcriptional regulator/Tfp pilus assembly protein PilF